jgi:hypothetical protein
MKEIYFVILYFLMAAATGQTVTQAFNEPSVGDVDKNYKLDTSAYSAGLPSVVTGSNVVWDFTKVTGTFPVIFDSIVSPSSATGGSTFPAATYAQKRSGINSFFRSSASPSQTEWIGVYSPSLTVTFTNSAIIATYPVSYGYSSTDPVTGTFKYNTTNGVCNGSITIIADGIGTLNLPNNVTFQNVLRLRSVASLTMSVGPLSVGSIDQSIFSYYVQGKKYPILTAQYQRYELLAGTPTITAMAYGNFEYFTVAGLNERSTPGKFAVYPNPFHDQLFLKNETEAEPDEILLYNLQGQLLARTHAIADLSGKELAPGIYLLEIKNSTGSSFQKVMKE